MMKKRNTVLYTLLTLACLVNASVFGMEGSVGAGPSGEPGLSHVPLQSVHHDTNRTISVTPAALAAAGITSTVMYAASTAKRGTNQASIVLEAIQKIKPYFTAGTYAAAKLQPFATAWQIQPVVNTILERLTPEKVGALAQEEGVLDIPVLRNALASYMVDFLVQRNPKITKYDLANTAESVFSFDPKGIMPDMHKHLAWRKSGVKKEWCIADLIKNDGMPQITGRRRLAEPDLEKQQLADSDGLDLMQLDLSNKKLTSLDGLQLIQGLNIVQDFKLDCNHLQILPANIFDGMVNLRNLWFFNNQIRNVQDGAFNGLNYLEILNIFGNPLSQATVNQIEKALPNALVEGGI